MSKTQRIEKLKQDYDTTSQVANITYKINEIIDFIQPKEELPQGTGDITRVVSTEPQIDQYTVDKILEVFYDGDWVSETSSGWTDENTNGYIIAKEEFTKFLKSFKNYL